MRRTIITTLAASTLLFAVLGWIGYAVPMYGGYRITSRLHGYVLFSAGLVRIYFLHANEGIYLEPSGGYALMTVRRSADDTVLRRFTHAFPGAISPYALVSDDLSPNQNAAASTFHLYGVRTRIWLPVALLLAYPVGALVRDRILHHRRGPLDCLGCGYDLTGNVSGRCPECGADASA